jgi:CheY-like chemotaxis protein
MEGEIAVASPTPTGQGTVFTFTLKVSTADQRRKAVVADNEKLTFKKTINALIVDDNKVNLLIARKTLQGFGAQVTVAESGAAALALAQNNNFDIVLMDIQMPEMDGYTATRRLREQNFTKPIIALSANAFDQHIEQSLSSGMNGHIEKPFNVKRLFEMICEHTQ